MRLLERILTSNQLWWQGLDLFQSVVIAKERVKELCCQHTTLAVAPTQSICQYSMEKYQCTHSHSNDSQHYLVHLNGFGCV